jgi:hypothetical protein
MLFPTTHSYTCVHTHDFFSEDPSFKPHNGSYRFKHITEAQGASGSDECRQHTSPGGTLQFQSHFPLNLLPPRSSGGQLAHSQPLLLPN